MFPLRAASRSVAMTASNRLALVPVAQDIALTVIFEDDALIVIDKPVGLVVQFGYKAGRVVVSTLGLIEHMAADPVATIMLNDLIEYCFTDFIPETGLP